METQLIELKKFFDKQVDGYILGDLEVLMKIEPDANYNKGCAIPAAMVILSASELFGTLLTPNPQEKEGAIYLKRFMEDYMPQISVLDRDSIVYNYRHKIMHIFFPKFSGKKMYGVTKIPNQNILIAKDSVYRNLNLVLFNEYFQQAVSDLKTKIFHEKNESIINTIFSNLFDDNIGTTTSTTNQTTIIS
ncbi:hypothetical protein [Flavihumibacter sp. ZG627]|uniref:hypothetical protein n=1 Tax=Flavihumibacter sp. ZG627 TaxID=1463156 RepID=UPI00057DAEF3|nr:hypothetical protein [Flavihumibacter sp. ZG627]KIC90004.1 hypothetical protein HY58_13420 [Flavihumibacter sp. ZG627]